MRVKIGPIEVQVNAFLIIVGGSFLVLDSLIKNEEFMKRLKESAEKAKQKKEQVQTFNVQDLIDELNKEIDKVEPND